MLFIEALDQFYDGKPDPRTLELLSMLPPKIFALKAWRLLDPYPLFSM
jgi:hypothetical protein